MEQDILSRLQKLPGKIGFYYKNLVTGEVITYQEEEAFMAASVIKLYVMAEAVRQCKEGILSKMTWSVLTSLNAFRHVEH